jgi:phenylalanyl-tRNA synthetase alpha chain
MLQKLEEMEKSWLKQVEAAADEAALKQIENAAIGKNGELAEILRAIPTLADSEKRTVGEKANTVKQALLAAIAERESLIRARELAQHMEEGTIDVTLPGRQQPTGRIHPSNQTLREFYDIWAEMGFQVFRSRDVEDDDTNFTLLNIPPYHPARDMWDTFHTTTPGVILRTHTSPGQIHAMREYAPEPIRVILPGMCYRYEQISTRSEVQFNQVEGLAVGYNIRMSDLKGTIASFARRMFGENARVRFRSSHFPFTEPSIEVDVECFICGGEGCAVCKQSGWLEIAGAGMVHPVVLKNGGYDPAKFSGFAFGMGPERITMLKHDISDIRYFWGNDLRFLEQF